MERIPVRQIIHDVGGSYRHRFGRVVIAAAIVFGVTAVIGAAVEDLLNKSQENFIVYVFALAGTTMSQVGITFYAGLLDKVVGEFELGEEPEPIMHVLRTLPYGSLIVADILITRRHRDRRRVPRHPRRHRVHAVRDHRARGQHRARRRDLGDAAVGAAGAHALLARALPREPPARASSTRPSTSRTSTSSATRWSRCSSCRASPG